jgi:hypothetical protein
VGDAAVRAGEPRYRDHGPSAAHHLAAPPRPRRPHAAGGGGAGARPGAAVRARTWRTWSRWWCGAARCATRASWWDGWAPTATAASSQVEHRGEFAVRGLDRRRVPVHRRRPGPHRPVGRRGRPAHRRSPSATSGPTTTSTRWRPSRAASCSPPTRCGARAEALVATEPWGREQWERLADGQTVRRHGVVAAVAHRRTTARSSTTWSTGAQVVLVEPRRLRDRAADIIAEEADLARRSGPHVGGGRRRTFPSAPRADFERPVRGQHDRCRCGP